MDDNKNYADETDVREDPDGGADKICKDQDGRVDNAVDSTEAETDYANDINNNIREAENDETEMIDNLRPILR